MKIPPLFIMEKTNIHLHIDDKTSEFLEKVQLKFRKYGVKMTKAKVASRILKIYTEDRSEADIDLNNFINLND